MIRINGTEYEAKITDALDGSMKITFTTGKSLDEVEDIFLSENPKIEVIENGETIAKYYNKSVKSLTVTGKEGDRSITVLLEASKVSEDTEATLTAEIETNSTALSDLAEVVSTNAETAETNGDALAELAETVAEIAGIASEQAEKVAQLIKDAEADHEVLIKVTETVQTLCDAVSDITGEVVSGLKKAADTMGSASDAEATVTESEADNG